MGTRDARLAVMVLMLLGRSMPAWADPQDIEEGEPVTLEAAGIEEPGRLAVQYSGTYSRVDLGGQSTDLVEQGPTFKLGVFKGVQVTLNPNYDSGSAQGHGAGFLLADVKAQLIAQTLVIPDVSVDVFYSLPFGPGQASTGAAVRMIASKSLGAGQDAPRLHLNLTDYHLATPGADARKDQLELAAGGSALFTPTDAVVADVVYGAADQAGLTETWLEIGWSRDLPADWTMQIGVGKQVGSGWRGERVFFAVEKEVQWF